MASPGYILANEKILPDDNTEFAYEGTVAHAVASNLLNPALDIVEEFKTWLKKNRKAAAEIRLHAQAYADFVRDKMQEGDTLLVEQRVPLFYRPQDRGTIDSCIIGVKRIYIPDFKYGMGVSVYAKNNEQLASYAESAIRQLELVEEIPDNTLVTLAIFQPRDRNDANAVRLWVLSRGELRYFCERIQYAADQITPDPMSPTLPFKAGPHCDDHFCKARGICKTYGEQKLAEFEVLSDQPIDSTLATTSRALTHLPDPKSLTRLQRVRVIRAASGLIKWMEQVEKQEIAELMKNGDRIGLKLVEGKSNRFWRDPIAAARWLAKYLQPEEINPPPSMVSPAQVEELLKEKKKLVHLQEELDELTTKNAGKPTLVEESDKRVALSFDPSHGFEDLTGSDLI